MGGGVGDCESSRALCSAATTAATAAVDGSCTRVESRQWAEAVLTVACVSVSVLAATHERAVDTAVTCSVGALRENQ